MTIKRTNFIFIRFDFVGLHYWREARQEVEYLKYKHRHKFFIECQIEVFHDDRELEYHMMLEELSTKQWINEEGNSCEMIANRILDYIEKQYTNRKIKIIVSEDNENGSFVSNF